ncbi:hypothetical protein [Limosilactobacillus caviae]|uniref:Phage head morphogenesis domain-containing protein n=1 Tax=Limosilactobacillus caviae TaxID=1769424 RepID=A0ABQ2C927_9LACO|nr:hypothetical protein [Limosilactobacillus caviae]MCD7125119.1 hypothetical protein [Limosilactobacillus caviae]GGI64244.1 hypothetical protein GCM10011459_20780 [Limosilactobacillus caviae]
MTTKNSYWERRAIEERKWQKANLADDVKFNRLLEQYYKEAIVQINKDIDQQYQALASATGGLRSAYRAVDDADIQAYMVEAQKVVNQANKLRALGKTVTYADFSDEVNQHMRVYNATMRINRLEYLKSQIGLHLTEANMNIDDSMRLKLTDSYVDEVKRQAGILGQTVKFNKFLIADNISKIVMAQTAGATWSQRLWANQDALKAQLDHVLATGFITGQSNQVMARRLKSQIKDTVNNARYVTERLARTESARVQYQAQIDSIKAADYKYVKWYAEPGACRVCQEIADNDRYDLGYGVFPVDEAPSIPVHPNCRCSISAYWVDGKDNLSKNGSKKVKKSSDAEDTINAYSDFEKLVKSNFKIKNVTGMEKTSPEALNKIYSALNRNFNRFPALKGELDSIKGYSKLSDRALGEYVSKEKMMKINVAKIDGFSEELSKCVKSGWWTPKKDFTGVIDHEFGHFVQFNYSKLAGSTFDAWEDDQKNQSWGNKLIYKALENSGEELSRDNVVKHCSKYGATNNYELFAEYFSNESDDPVVKEFNKLLNAEKCFKKVEK